MSTGEFSKTLPPRYIWQNDSTYLFSIPIAPNRNGNKYKAERCLSCELQRTYGLLFPHYFSWYKFSHSENAFDCSLIDEAVIYVQSTWMENVICQIETAIELWLLSCRQFRPRGDSDWESSRTDFNISNSDDAFVCF